MNWHWNQNRVDEFMQSVATGFVPPSPLELALQFGVLFLAIVVYVYLYRRMRDRQRQAREEYSADRLIELSHAARLSPGDRDLLHQLSQYLDRPREEAHLLLQQRSLFEKAVHALLESEYPAAEIARAARPFNALAVRLGFATRDAGRMVQSSGDLPVGTILYDSDETERFRVLAVHPAQLDVEVLTELQPGGSGRELELHFRRPEGLYTMRCRLLATESGGRSGSRAVLAHHMGRVRRRQNRDYFRRALRRPVRLRLLTNMQIIPILAR